MVSRVVAKQAPAEVFGGAREHKVRSRRTQFVPTLGGTVSLGTVSVVDMQQPCSSIFTRVCGCHNPSQVLLHWLWLQQPYSSTFTHVCGCNNPVQEFSSVYVAATTTLFKYFNRVGVAATTLFKYFYTLRVAVLTLFKEGGLDHLSEKHYSFFFFFFFFFFL